LNTRCYPYTLITSCEAQLSGLGVEVKEEVPASSNDTSRDTGIAKDGDMGVAAGPEPKLEERKPSEAVPEKGKSGGRRIKDRPGTSTYSVLPRTGS